MMRTCRITVLKNTFQKDLVEEYGYENFGPCTAMPAGKTFLTKNEKPDGFCSDAWIAISQYVFALTHGDGKTMFYDNNWVRMPGVAICSCNDGLRPVIFKIEALDVAE